MGLFSGSKKYVWPDGDSRQAMNDGTGCCRTSMKRRGCCSHMGMGCDVDHAANHKRWSALQRAKREVR